MNEEGLKEGDVEKNSRRVLCAGDMVKHTDIGNRAVVLEDVVLSEGDKVQVTTRFRQAAWDMSKLVGIPQSEEIKEWQAQAVDCLASLVVLERKLYLSIQACKDLKEREAKKDNYMDIRRTVVSLRLGVLSFA